MHIREGPIGSHHTNGMLTPFAPNDRLHTTEDDETIGDTGDTTSVFATG